MVLHVIIERRISNLRLWFLLLNNLSWLRKGVDRTSIIRVINLESFHYWRCNLKNIAAIRVNSFIHQALIVVFTIVAWEIIACCKTIVNLSIIGKIIRIDVWGDINLSVGATMSVVVVGVIVGVVIASILLGFILRYVIRIRGTLW